MRFCSTPSPCGSRPGKSRRSPSSSGFLAGAGDLGVPFILVSDEVGLGVVPESEAGRRFRDELGLVNQRAAETADEVHLCVAGVGRQDQVVEGPPLLLYGPPGAWSLSGRGRAGDPSAAPDRSCYRIAWGRSAAGGPLGAVLV